MQEDTITIPRSLLERTANLIAQLNSKNWVQNDERGIVFDDLKAALAQPIIESKIFEDKSAQPAQEPAQEPAQTYWMIECKNGFFGWWTGQGKCDCRFFNTDPHKGKRFATKSEAESAICNSCQIATSHQDVDMHEAQPAQEPQLIADEVPGAGAIYSAGEAQPAPQRKPISNLLTRATELHEKAFMPWDQAEKLALSESGIDDADIDEIIGNFQDSGIAALLDGDELRAYTRSIIVYAQNMILAAQPACDRQPVAQPAQQEPADEFSGPMLVQWLKNKHKRHGELEDLKAAELLESLLAQQERKHEHIEGDLLPPIGSKVLIHLASLDKWVEHTVLGYYVGPTLKDDRNVFRVFIRVQDSQGYLNDRLLQDVRLTQAEPGITGGKT